jgi:Ca2+-binding RTX toxin-like protein
MAGDALMPPTTGDDFLTLTTGNDTLDALAGNDFVEALEGDDSIFGNDGADTLTGDAGADTLDGGNDADNLDGGADNDLLIGGAGADFIDGGAGDDTMQGGTGLDVFHVNPLVGGSSIDHIADFEAGDRLLVGSGSQTSREPEFYSTFIGTAAFSGTVGEIRYSTGGGTTTIEVDADGDALADYTTIIDNGEFTLRAAQPWGGSLEIDAAYGGAPTAGDDGIGGSSGADSIDGGAGLDTLRGAAGNDTLIGGADADLLAGMSGDDSLDGGLGDDTMEGSQGQDTVAGGDGNDVLTFNFEFDRAVDMLITDTLVSDFASGDQTTISGIEQFQMSQRLSGNYNDTFDGSAATFSLLIFAGAGDDVIIGGSGNDTNLEGDSGRDTLTGGLGADTFDYDFFYEIDTIGDEITDFEVGDRIDFLSMEIETPFGEGVPLSFIGTSAFTGVAGEIRYQKANGLTMVELDSDGDTIADGLITLTNGEFDLIEASPGVERLVIASDSASGGADDIVGTNGDDFLEGLGGADTIQGLAGADTLDGGDSDDSLLGGDGADQLLGGHGLDQLSGGDGDDVLNGGTESDIYTGGAGCDLFQINPLEAAIDFITDFEICDFIELGGTGGTSKDPGPDLLTFIGTAAFTNTAGEVRYATGVGVTIIEVDIDGDGSADQTVQINNGEFDLRQTVPGGPTLISVSAFGATTAGDDTIYGSTGADTITGGDGADFLNGMEGDDSVLGGNGDDSFQEHVGNDTIDGGAGEDQLTHFYGEALDLTLTDTSIINAVTGETDAIANIERVFISNRLAPPSDDTLSAALATIRVDLHGGAGNDRIVGGSNIDNIEGDNGADTLFGGLAGDTFDFDYLTEVADDQIMDLEVGDIIDLGGIDALGEAGDPDGDDLTFIGAAAFTGVAGEMRYSYGGGQTIVEIDENGDAVGDHFIYIRNGEFNLSQFGLDSARLRIIAAAATAGADNIVGTNSAEAIDALDGADTVQGLGGNDTLAGAAGNDKLNGGAGRDSLDGGNGNDTLLGGTENDTMSGGKGYDYASGGDGADSIDGGDLADTLNGDAGNDFLRGGADNDRLNGGSQRDQIFGDDGDDVVDAGTGDDTIDGGTGRDKVFGGSGIDSIIGGGGNDTLQGGNDADALAGGAGFDILEGGAGDDTLDGGDLNDVIFGNAGNDMIVFRKFGDTDTIRDFTAGAGVGDVVRLVGFGAAFDSFAEVLAAATDDGVHTTITFGGGDVIVLRGVLVSQLAADDFTFG